MRFEEFKDKVANMPYIRSHIFPLLTDNPNFLRRQVAEWASKGKIIILKRGMYMLAPKEKKVSISKIYLANELYPPSYISLETALSYYQLIPERVEAITSITSKKTVRLENEFGKFIYRHIKQNGFRYYIQITDEYGYNVFMATPEKALVDYLYLNAPNTPTIDSDYFTYALRLQNTEILNRDKLSTVATIFSQEKVDNYVNVLINMWGNKND